MQACLWWFHLADYGDQISIWTIGIEPADKNVQNVNIENGVRNRQFIILEKSFLFFAQKYNSRGSTPPFLMDEPYGFEICRPYKMGMTFMLIQITLLWSMKLFPLTFSTLIHPLISLLSSIPVPSSCITIFLKCQLLCLVSH